MRLSDKDWRQLSTKAKALGRSVLEEIANLVMPDTLRAWYRHLIARKWTCERKRPVLCNYYRAESFGDH